MHAPARVLELSINAFESCALLEGDRVFCWGALGFSECTASDRAVGSTTTPRFIPWLSGRGLAQLSLSGPRCALQPNGRVLCWGPAIPQAFGQGGDDYVSLTWEHCQSPTEVPLDDVVELRTGARDRVCARRGDGSVWCWGFNFGLTAYPDVEWTNAFRASTGSWPNAIPTPRAVPRVAKAIGIALAGAGCALFQDRHMSCWGGGHPASDEYDTESPRASELDDVRDVAPGDSSYVVVLTGEGLAWRFMPTSGYPSKWTVPQRLPVFDGASRIFAGWDRHGSASFAVALFHDGSLATWAPEPQRIPAVTGITGVRLVAAAGEHLCVVRGDDEVLCGGRNEHGQLGDGTREDRWTLQPVFWELSPR